MVGFYIEVLYDGEAFGSYYVEALNFDSAKSKICDEIYNEGVINPWLRVVDERLTYNVVDKRKL